MVIMRWSMMLKRPEKDADYVDVAGSEARGAEFIPHEHTSANNVPAFGVMAFQSSRSRLGLGSMQ